MLLLFIRHQKQMLSLTLLMLMIAKTHDLELRIKGAGKIKPQQFTMDGFQAGSHKFPGGHLLATIGHDGR